jgi:hypothetical protein
MQIEATTRGEWVLEPDFAEPSRSQRASARGWGSLTGRDRFVIGLGGVLFALAAASLGARVHAGHRLYTPFF